MDIYRNDTLVTSVIENDAGNYYTTEFHPAKARSYRIDVRSAGMRTARARVTIPPTVEIAVFDTRLCRCLINGLIA